MPLARSLWVRETLSSWTVWRTTATWTHLKWRIVVFDRSSRNSDRHSKCNDRLDWSQWRRHSNLLLWYQRFIKMPVLLKGVMRRSRRQSGKSRKFDWETLRVSYHITIFPNYSWDNTIADNLWRNGRTVDRIVCEDPNLRVCESRSWTRRSR